MNLTDDEILKFLKGTPVFLDDICAIYCPTIGEIVDLGYSDFSLFLSILTAQKPELKESEDQEFTGMLNSLSDFQYLLMLASIDLKVNESLKRAFQFFIHESISLSLNPAEIIIGPLEEKHILDERKFHDFQKIIKIMCFLDSGEPDIIIDEDDPPKLKELKMKMRRDRELLKKAKQKKNSESGIDLKLSDLIGSIAINNCGLNIKDIFNITYYAFHDQLKRMGWRDQFNINNSAALAGAKLNKNQMKHWMRSIADSDKS